MKKIQIKQLLFLSLVFLFTSKVQAHLIEGKEKKVGGGFRTAEACTPPSASAQLEINNTRCMLYNGGDMWWDLVGNPRYEIPKGSGKHSMFAASLWIGGTDAAGQMRVAAQTYRQDGYDFWPGPLSQGKGEVDNIVCDAWNKMFVVTKAQIDKFRSDFAKGTVNYGDYPAIKDWPARGTALDKDLNGDPIVATQNGQEIYAAPFVDVDGNPLVYNPDAGDYPLIKGDQAVFWIINDKGNIHTATSGQPIGVEMHIMAFAFTTANAVNNMTFYDQLVINRSSLTLTNTYLGQWVDADLGFYNDDFVGCDTTKGLGYVYNSDNDDNLPNGYGANPPAIGVDFFQGPLADIGDGIDNDKDGVADEQGEQIIMSKFVYYNNDFSLKGNPETATHYYNYLRGIWKDGTTMVNNGKDAYAATAPGNPTNYIFPGSVCNQTGWIEGSNAGTAAADRRFLQSAGPFTLQSGAVNEIITGVVWARGSSNTNSVCELLTADLVAQALFDSNFKLLQGPDAPTVEVGEFDKSIVLSWAGSKESNNYNESYVQSDPVLKAKNIPDSLYRFQGYLVYQLADNSVGLNDLSNPDKAQLVAQCDIVDNVTTIVNSTSVNVDGQTVVNDEVMVTGENKGIFHSIKVTQDLFATDQYTSLKNYTPYYYAVVAYAYNNDTLGKRKFVLGNGGFDNAKVMALPHGNKFEEGGTTLNSTYGDGIPITQVGGYGNGGNFVQLTQATEDKIIQNFSVTELAYQQGAAPVKVKVVDPQLLKNLNYTLKVINSAGPVDSITLYKNPNTGVGQPEYIKDYIYSDWELYADGKRIYQSKYYQRNDGSTPRPSPRSGNEQVILETLPNGKLDNHGFSIAVTDVLQAGDADNAFQTNGGVVGSSLTFSDPNKAWLTGIKDDDSKGDAVWNWILAGPTNADQKVGLENRVLPFYVADSTSSFEKIINGTWAPFCFAREFLNGIGGEDPRPGVNIGTSRTNFSLSAQEVLGLNELSDIELVITPDESKWTRCVVVEASSNSTLGAGSWLLSGKWKANVDKKGNPETSGPQVENHGLGWFPGYAYNVNTGQRLCVFFSEADFDHLNNGDDMKFNPTFSYGPNLDKVGGRHNIYVTDLPYTGENNGGMDSLKKYLLNNNCQNAAGTTSTDALLLSCGGDEVHLGDIYRHVAWTSIAMAQFGYVINDPHDFPSDARVAIRVNQKFRNQSLGGIDEPTFNFSTNAVSAKKNDNEVATSALDMIQVVPNPYYAYSAYEDAQLQSLVKITNLPKKCTISIYTLNGQIVKTYNKDSDVPEQLWDLKNEQGVPAASGVYIVHINAPGVGEKVVKMLAVMRQLDLNGY